MKRFNTMAMCLLAVGGFLLAGCGGSDDGGGDGGGDLPGLSSILWTANGGSALTGAATNGGKGGVVQMTVSGDILNDDGRTRPTVSTNFLTMGVTGDGTVTYTELASLGSVAVASGTATFTLPGGTGFELASGITLNLSDAPAGTVDSVVISGNSEMIIAGVVVLTRAASDSVNFSISTSQNATAPILFTGQIQGAGSATRDGGSFSVSTTGTTAGVIFLGNGNVSGGLGDAATDGGDAGAVAVTCTGDLLVPVFSVLANGGAGSAAGGNAGTFGLNNQAATGNFFAPFNYGLQANGGAGGTGNGGNGGTLQILGPSTTNTVWCRAEVRGGSSTGGNGGAGGQAIVGSATTGAVVGAISGTLYATSDGGDSENGNAGAGGVGLMFAGATATNAVLTGSAKGGASTVGGNGGNGGGFQFVALDVVDSTLNANVNGGAGEVNGGNGGTLTYARAGTVAAASVWMNPSVSSSANGGNGITGNGGNGGNLIFGQTSGTTIDATGASLNFTANGGTGVNGGNGGALTADNTDGALAYTISFTANGGAANGTAGTTTNGGAGGWLTLNNDSGSITASVSANMNGGAGADVAGVGGNGGAFKFSMTNLGAGNGTLDITVSGNANGGAGAGTGNGGAGGTLMINPNDSTVTNAGTATAVVNLALRGGTAVMGSGGFIATVTIGCGTGGSFTSSNFTVDGRGGDSQNAQGGYSNVSYSLTASFGGPCTISGGTLDFHGGSGATVSGNGDGYQPQDFTINTTGFAITITQTWKVYGGTGGGTGAGGGNAWDLNVNLDSDANGSAGSFTFNGSIDMHGGNALGSGTGGTGGQIAISDGAATSGGSVSINATINGNGGNSASGNGGADDSSSIDVNGNVTISGSWTQNGGTGNNGGGGLGGIDISSTSNITINGTITNNGGNGTSSGGDGGTINVGNNTETLITLNSSAVLRANGGSGTAIGAAGFINLNPAGTGGGNLSEASGSVVQTNDGAGVDQSATNITRD